MKWVVSVRTYFLNFVINPIFESKHMALQSFLLLRIVIVTIFDLNSFFVHKEETLPPVKGV